MGCCEEEALHQEGWRVVVPAVVGHSLLEGSVDLCGVHLLLRRLKRGEFRCWRFDQRGEVCMGGVGTYGIGVGFEYTF